MSSFEFKDDSDQELLNEIIRLGPWVDHNIRLSSNVSTLGVDKGQNHKITHVMDILVSLLGPRFDNYSFLDLACLEGGYSIEAALLGAKVLGIEGRQKNWFFEGSCGVERARVSFKYIECSSTNLYSEA